MPNNDSSFDFATFLADRLSIRDGPPDPDPIDPAARPHAALAGANIRNLIACPVCGKPGTPTPLPAFPRAFFFHDADGVKEYSRTGTCQDCQYHLCEEYDDGE